MDQVETNQALPSPEQYTRRAVRAWSADGLWDLAVVGYLALLAIWGYYLVRVLDFPSWTWPWPFHTVEVLNPLRDEITFWTLGIIPASVLYLWGAYRLVALLKRKLIAPFLGDVRHRFFLPVEAKVYLVHIGFYLVGIYLLALLCHIFKGGNHFFSVCCAVAPAGATYMMGRVYGLSRYKWAAGVGLLAAVGLEIFATTNASFMEGPHGFFDVSARSGNPALPLAVWAVVFLISGLTGINAALRCRDER